MDMTTERKDGVLAASIGGRIDGTNSADFEQAIRTAVQDDDRAVIVDLEQLSYISSAGLRAVLLTAKYLSNQGAKFALCSLTGPIKEVFEVSGFDKIIAIHGSRADALADVTARP